MAVAASSTLQPSSSPALGPKPEPQLVVRNTFLELFEETPLLDTPAGGRPRGNSDMTHLRLPEKVQYIPRGLQQLHQRDAAGCNAEGITPPTAALPVSAATPVPLQPVCEVFSAPSGSAPSGAQVWDCSRTPVAIHMPAGGAPALPSAQGPSGPLPLAGPLEAWGYNVYTGTGLAPAGYAGSSQSIPLAAASQRTLAPARGNPGNHVVSQHMKAEAVSSAASAAGRIARPQVAAPVGQVSVLPVVAASPMPAVTAGLAAPPAAASAASAAAALTTHFTPVPGEPTTVMLRNIPNRYTQNMLVELLDQSGFQGLYDFVYLPMDFRNGVNLGYAFVNLLNHHEALKAMNCFQGFSQWFFDSAKVCEVSWAHPHQGLDEHVERYRNSPVMHASMPDEYKPMLFNNGVRVQFPPPTKIIRAPKLRPVRDRAQNADGLPVSPVGV